MGRIGRDFLRLVKSVKIFKIIQIIQSIQISMIQIAYEDGKKKWYWLNWKIWNDQKLLGLQSKLKIWLYIQYICLPVGTYITKESWLKDRNKGNKDGGKDMNKEEMEGDQVCNLLSVHGWLISFT